MAEKTDVSNFAVNPDEQTVHQYEHCYSQSYVARAALMPDAHVGYVAPIGAVLSTTGVVVPSWVGFDIGCGMTAARLENVDLTRVREHSEAIYLGVKRSVPMGLGNVHKKTDRISKETKETFDALVKEFERGPHDKKILDFIRNTALRHLGTLGHGNHFIELGTDDHGAVWVTIHSGSRGIGHAVAKQYMQKSSGDMKKYEATHPLTLDSQLGREYMNVLVFGLEFALLNRMEILRQVIETIGHLLGIEISFEVWANKNHNHAVFEGDYLVHRKGATPAHTGERGVIPANMRDGCFLVEGKGNPDFLESSSHGAGRIFGRKEASEKISMKAFAESMQGIRGTVSEGTLDEAPMAYKDISAVMDAQKDSVKIVGHVKPLINWKGEKRRNF